MPPPGWGLLWLGLVLGSACVSLGSCNLASNSTGEFRVFSQMTGNPPSQVPSVLPSPHPPFPSFPLSLPPSSLLPTYGPVSPLFILLSLHPFFPPMLSPSYYFSYLGG